MYKKPDIEKIYHPQKHWWHKKRLASSVIDLPNGFVVTYFDYGGVVEKQVTEQKDKEKNRLVQIIEKIEKYGGYSAIATGLNCIEKVVSEYSDGDEPQLKKKTVTAYNQGKKETEEITDFDTNTRITTTNFTEDGIYNNQYIRELPEYIEIEKLDGEKLPEKEVVTSKTTLVYHVNGCLLRKKSYIRGSDGSLILDGPSVEFDEFMHLIDVAYFKEGAQFSEKEISDKFKELSEFQGDGPSTTRIRDTIFSVDEITEIHEQLKNADKYSIASAREINPHLYDKGSEVLYNQEYNNSDGSKVIAEFHANGKLDYAAYYNPQGKQDGEMPVFDDQGTMKEKDFYENGVCMLREKYDADGNISEAILFIQDADIVITRDMPNLSPLHKDIIETVLKL